MVTRTSRNGYYINLDCQSTTAKDFFIGKQLIQQRGLDATHIEATGRVCMVLLLPRSNSTSNQAPFPLVGFAA